MTSVAASISAAFGDDVDLYAILGVERSADASALRKVDSAASRLSTPNLMSSCAVFPKGLPQEVPQVPSGQEPRR
eukprot:9496560-Prorocentrum_lima.AAC.1